MNRAVKINAPLCISQISVHQLNRVLLKMKNNDKLIFFSSFCLQLRRLVCILSRLDERKFLAISSTLHCIWGKLFEVFCAILFKRNVKSIAICVL